jgi:hypothetical protein
VPEITTAVSKCKGKRVYVSNLRPQTGETAGYDVAAHLFALARHGVMIDAVVADTSAIALGDFEGLEVQLVEAKVAKRNGRAHDPGKLAVVLASLVA